MNEDIRSAICGYGPDKLGTRSTMLAINFYGDDYGAAFLTIEKLARIISCTERSVLRFVQDLERSGRITVHRKIFGDSLNAFFINLDLLGIKPQPFWKKSLLHVETDRLLAALKPAGGGA